VWHRMFYSCTHMSTVGVKGLSSVMLPAACDRAHSFYSQTVPFPPHCTVDWWTPTCSSDSPSHCWNQQFTYTSYHHTITTTLADDHNNTGRWPRHWSMTTTLDHESGTTSTWCHPRLVSVILNSHKTVKILFVCLTIVALVIFNWHLKML